MVSIIKPIKVTILTSSILLITALALLTYSFLIYRKYNVSNPLQSVSLQSIQLESLPENNKLKLDKLPENFLEITQEYSLEINNKDIVAILNDGYLSIPIEKKIDIQSNTPLLLTTENVTEYFNQSTNIAKKSIKEKVDKKLDKIAFLAKKNIPLVYIFASKEEKPILSSMYMNSIDIYKLKNKEGEVFLKLLNLTNEKEEYLNIMKVIGEITIENKTENNVQQNEIDNTIYLEPNKQYYESLITLITDKKEILKQLHLYNNEYEPIIDTMTKIVNEDSSVYNQVISLDKDNLLLYAINNQTVTISTTQEIRENTILNDNNFDIDYKVTPTQQSKGSVRIPVLMYHQIVTPPVGAPTFVAGLYTSPEEFEKQIAYLTEMNYKTIDSQEFLDILVSGKNPTQKTVMLTFDDGTISHYTQAYPILKKYKQTGVFFVVSHRTTISNAQLKEMSDNGMDIESHTQTHPDLVKLTNLNQMQNEIGGSKSELEARTGKSVVSIAYPGCVAGSSAFSMVASNGYRLGFSCGKSIDHRYSTNLSLSRVHAPRNIDDLDKILSGIYPF